jgi:hypothetical protein
MRSHELRAEDTTTLPPLPVLQAALRKTTELLARELAMPSTQSPRWTDLEWRIAEAAAVMQGTSALLANRLRWHGPARWRQFLETQRHQTQLRHSRIAGLLECLDAGGRAAGIPFVALKGAALYRMGAYPRQDRPMGDVDLLVRPADFEAARRFISAAGYETGLLTERHQLFEPLERSDTFSFGEHVDHPIKIDLHTRIAERLPIATADITALEFPAYPHPGLNGYESDGALLRHLLLHAATNMRARALRFIQLYDIALLGSRVGASEWGKIMATARATDGMWWAFAPLALTARYFPASIPRAVLDATMKSCPVLLRRAAGQHVLTDVSWSQLRIQAFPGIEWCRSPQQALRFVMSRVFPSRKRIEALHTVTIKRPYGASVPWYGLSHVNRIARWVLSSPPRVQAIYPIRIALGIQRP